MNRLLPPLLCALFLCGGWNTCTKPNPETPPDGGQEVDLASGADDLGSPPDLGPSGCARDSECASGLCLNERCAEEAGVVYVDGGRSYCMTGDEGKGTRAEPYCEVQVAANQAGERKHVHITPGPVYGEVMLRGARLALYGGDRHSFPDGQLPKLKGLHVAHDSEVLADGLYLSGSKYPAVCQGDMANGKLSLRRTMVEGGAVGVLSEFCGSLGLDQVQILRADEGLRIGPATLGYDVQNTLIARNTGVGVFLASDSKGRFQFNTVADNGTVGAGDPGGVRCDSRITGAFVISQSIVVGNTLFDGSQFTAGCALKEVVVGRDALGGTQIAPSFVSQGKDYRLQTLAVANQECCLNKADTGPDHDHFGAPRPGRVRGYTLGFHEP